MPFLVVENLSTSYSTENGKVHAVQNVSFSMNAGESIGIAGESACGKSTLGLSIMRTLQGGTVESGRILLDGESILDVTDEEFARHFRWKKLSMVFQGAMNSLDPVYTIGQQFSDVLREHGHLQNHLNVMTAALRSVNLDPQVLKKYPHELSGGMKQRAVIAMALLLKPRLVIADEPTTALDVLVQSQILNLFKMLKKENTSFMLISHDLATISEICEKIGIMYGGRMVEFGSSEEIFEKPKHPYTQALIKSIPKLHSDQRPQYIPGSPPSLLNAEPGCRFIQRCPHVMEKCKKDPKTTKTDSGYVQCFLYE
ncbi:ABC transporter ATP-binding protein [Candidatus Nitrosotenuis uzonensis]|uniref:Oligopeptide transport ATP-binding protein OppD n=1 Tax=Candidatus Nitrosotenuis uzonensis TaxID=1407055 RepID=A0A812EWZ0_9ARCH|nr:ABC transporter ATP-binding protein [Candidatus Nitrosotenuis uzonensis]CAE6497645.1 Oligopeptide transport ATP-binding protein OppD [Candidatus Nitrosotenuis uzonensis]